ncbi:Lrp/AsnC family transcriptional regulator [Neobacillus sp. D3-1R]|uniref:Lrp/AsnC family transcriptional regulator n=1 Tax=Neobacillus sp. D3-1R TaxID=3445778 RepID=UPI003F9F2809
MAAIDHVDLEIIDLLKQNSRMTWKEIGDIVHMTGQAVAARITKLEDLGVIEGYTVKLNAEKLGYPILAIVLVFMKTTNHSAFHTFIHEHSEIKEAFRVSGEGCYSLKINTATQDDLVQILDKILAFGNYRVNISLSKIK